MLDITDNSILVGTLGDLYIKYQITWKTTPNDTRPLRMADHLECYQTFQQTIRNATRPLKQTIRYATRPLKQTIRNATRPLSRPFGMLPYLLADHSECYHTSRQTIRNVTRLLGRPFTMLPDLLSRLFGMLPDLLGRPFGMLQTSRQTTRNVTRSLRVLPDHLEDHSE